MEEELPDVEGEEVVPEDVFPELTAPLTELPADWQAANRKRRENRDRKRVTLRIIPIKSPH